MASKLDISKQEASPHKTQYWSKLREGVGILWGNKTGWIGLGGTELKVTFNWEEATHRVNSGSFLQMIVRSLKKSGHSL